MTLLPIDLVPNRPCNISKQCQAGRQRHIPFKVKFYERELFSDKLETAAVTVDKYGDIVIQCLYEGHDDFYRFSLRFEVFRLKYDNARRIYYKTFREVEQGQWMAAMMVETEHGALLEELVELKSLPKFFENAELENYIMKFD